MTEKKEVEKKKNETLTGSKVSAPLPKKDKRWRERRTKKSSKTRTRKKLET